MIIRRFERCGGFASPHRRLPAAHRQVRNEYRYVSIESGKSDHGLADAAGYPALGELDRSRYEASIKDQSLSPTLDIRDVIAAWLVCLAMAAAVFT